MVYVGPIQVSLKSKKWPYSHHCYLIADSIKELHRFAQRIGLLRSWFQGKTLPHYDLTPGKRASALCMGAVEIDNKEIIRKLRKHWGRIK